MQGSGDSRKGGLNGMQCNRGGSESQVMVDMAGYVKSTLRTRQRPRHHGCDDLALLQSTLTPSRKHRNPASHVSDVCPSCHGRSPQGLAPSVAMANWHEMTQDHH